MFINIFLSRKNTLMAMKSAPGGLAIATFNKNPTDGVKPANLGQNLLA
jgi:hypothetical protein